MMSMEGDRIIKSLLHEDFLEAQPTISPDGRWLAYISGESAEEVAHTEVYISPFPEVNKSRGKVDIGYCPLWSPDSKELYYLSVDNSVMAVSVKTEPSLTLESPRTLFLSKNIGYIYGAGYPWDVHPDGNRFLMIKPSLGQYGETTVSGPRKINIIVNWFEELKEKEPVD